MDDGPLDTGTNEFTRPYPDPPRKRHSVSLIVLRPTQTIPREIEAELDLAFREVGEKKWVVIKNRWGPTGGTIEGDEALGKAIHEAMA